MDERNGSFREMKKSSFFKNERKKTNDFNCSNDLEKKQFFNKKNIFLNLITKNYSFPLNERFFRKILENNRFLLNQKFCRTNDLTE